jgi:dipeptidyl-peptidase-3
MRNRKWVSEWVYKNGLKDNVIEKISRDGKTYFNINDYDKLRVLFGKLLRETQRIKSEGDYDAAEKLVEGFGVKVDQDLHAEILKRNKKFKGAAYSGFVNPELIPVYNEENKLIDIEVKYVNSFVYQMLQYSDRFGFLD